ncbi:hypothetical protein PENSPDRAFT_376882 [Peniophora sp. CONT]|nr:hypothetical protein PENSPDRAFT_376882 [Peniophora sp. CONT]
MIEHSGPDNSWVLQNDLIEIVNIYDTYGRIWQVLLPLIPETVLFGFASFLFSMAAYTSFDIFRFKGRSGSSLVIPVMASVMYTLSLAHWAVSVHYFAVSAKITYIGNPNGSFATQKSFTALVSMNAVMSDSIVLWRMYVVWNRARPILAFGIAAFVTVLGLNIANIVGVADSRVFRGVVNLKDSEFFVIYGITSIGLAAAFVSLASNLCATALVGLKIWLHRRQLTTHVRTGNRRTMVERVMELLVDSGVVYTAIWLLYCISFFRPITDQAVLGPASKGSTIDITAASYLDAAMAQITSIYPLIVFILVALDKIHHSRGPQILRNNEWPKERGPLVTVTFDIDVERSTAVAVSPTSAHPMMALPRTSNLPSAVDNAKVSGTVTS